MGDTPERGIANLLPDFAESFCRAFTACGRLVGIEGEEAVENLPGYNQDIVAAYNSQQGRTIAHLSLSKSKKSASYHLHVDLALKKYFRNSVPNSTHKRRHIEQVIRRLSGCEIIVSGSALFELPTHRIDPRSLIAMVLKQEWKAGKISIKPNSIQLAFEGLDLAEISWIPGKSRLRVFVETDAVRGPVDETYLPSFFDFTENFIGLAVWGKPTKELK